MISRHLGSRQVSRLIYGAIIGLALVVALQAHPPPPGAVIASLLGTAVAVALAEVYSELVGFETVRQRRATSAETESVLVNALAVGIGIGFRASSSCSRSSAYSVTIRRSPSHGGPDWACSASTASPEPASPGRVWEARCSRAPEWPSSARP